MFHLLPSVFVYVNYSLFRRNRTHRLAPILRPLAGRRSLHAPMTAETHTDATDAANTAMPAHNAAAGERRLRRRTLMHAGRSDGTTGPTRSAWAARTAQERRMAGEIGTARRAAGKVRWSAVRANAARIGRRLLLVARLWRSGEAAGWAAGGRKALRHRWGAERAAGRLGRGLKVYNKHALTDGQHTRNAKTKMTPRSVVVLPIIVVGVADFTLFINMATAHRQFTIAIAGMCSLI